MRPSADIVYRCDAGHGIGMGHLSRGLALAEELRARHGLSALFAGRLEEAARAQILEADHEIRSWEGGAERDWLASVFPAGKRPVLVCDVRTALTRSELVTLRPLVAGLVTLDDASERRLAADLCFMPPTAVARALDWSSFSGSVHMGWDWVVLRRPPLQRSRLPARLLPPWRLLLTMGGADPRGLTFRLVPAFASFAPELELTAVLGPAVEDPEFQVRELRAAFPSARVIKSDDLRPLMAECDAALVTYGVTAQELAASGTPALYLCLDDDHEVSAQALAATGAGICLGRYDHLSDDTITGNVMSVLRDPVRRQAMQIAAARALDGRGAQRIADLVARLAA